MEEINYYTFCIGYDLLNDYFAKSNAPECDVVYEECRKLAVEFIQSINYRDKSQSSYDNLKDWIEQNRVWIEHQYVGMKSKNIKSEREVR